MKRLTAWSEKTVYLKCDICEEGNPCDNVCRDVPIYRLAAIEDILGNDYDLDRLRELVEADREGRVAVFYDKILPLIWGDENRDTVLCPNCGRDLMGGFPCAETCEGEMHQCPYCGQPVDGTKAITREEAEAALERMNKS